MMRLFISIVLVLIILITPILVVSDSLKQINALNLLPDGMIAGSMNRPITKGECVSMITAVLDWGELYRIEMTRSFWARFWLKVRRFFSYVQFDFERMRSFTAYPNALRLATAIRWNIDIKPQEINKPVKGWQMLELESLGLSEALSMAGIPRTLTEEINNISSQLALVPKNLRDRYNQLPTPQRREHLFEPTQEWIYYIFALQHDLLPKWADSNQEDGGLNETPEIILGKSLTCGQAVDFLEKELSFLKAMADDLSQN